MLSREDDLLLHNLPIPFACMFAVLFRFVLNPVIYWQAIFERELRNFTVLFWA